MISRRLTDLPLPALLTSLCETARLLGVHAPDTSTLRAAIETKFSEGFAQHRGSCAARQKRPAAGRFGRASAASDIAPGVVVTGFLEAELNREGAK
jgi:hypothetical protein